MRFREGDTIEIKEEPGIDGGMVVFGLRKVLMPCGEWYSRKQALQFNADLESCGENEKDLDGMIQQVEAERLWPKGWNT